LQGGNILLGRPTLSAARDKAVLFCTNWLVKIFADANSDSFTDGAKKLALNEKERGFPNGLRVMSESDGAGDCILHIPSSFDNLEIRGGPSQVLTAVEV